MTLSRGLVLVVAVCAMAALMGCNSGDDNTLYQNISDRAAWSITNTLAFTSFGGNGRKYIYRSADDGGGQYLLTATAYAELPNNDGGWHPCFSPDGLDIAYTARRRGGSSSLYIMPTEEGDRTEPARVTDNTVAGEDIQSTWSPDGTTLLYVTTKQIGGVGDGDYNVATVPAAAGSASTLIVGTNADEQWPVYSPDGTRIAYQYRAAGAVRTDIHICNADGSGDVELTTAALLPGTSTRNEAPAWGTVGGEEWIYFHSNRSGDFDIWRIHPDGTGLAQVTDSPQSNGYPVVRPDGTEVMFTRDRELWAKVTAPTGSDDDERRITRRY